MFLRYLITIFFAASILNGCDFTVTKERPKYSDLKPEEKDVVDVVLDELRAFDLEVVKNTPYTIQGIIDREKIHVSFSDLVFAGNLGDDVIHIAVWENTNDAQKQKAMEWFGKTNLEDTKAVFEKFFYVFMGMNQGAKEYYYQVLTPEWVIDNRTLFSVEQDSVRITLSYYKAVGRDKDMFPFLTTACATVLQKYGAQFGPDFSMEYLAKNFRTLANPEDPTGYMYYLCRFIESGERNAKSIKSELNWVPTIKQE